MTPSIEQLPAAINQALIERAARDGRSVQEVVLEAIVKGLGEDASPSKLDLSDIVGTWVEDPEFDEAMKDFGKVGGARQ